MTVVLLFITEVAQASVTLGKIFLLILSQDQFPLFLAYVLMLFLPVLTLACMEKFPGMPKGMLGAAINGKLTELRLKVKMVDNTDGADQQ